MLLCYFRIDSKEKPKVTPKIVAGAPEWMVVSEWMDRKVTEVRVLWRGKVSFICQ